MCVCVCVCSGGEVRGSRGGVGRGVRGNDEVGRGSGEDAGKGREKRGENNSIFTCSGKAHNLVILLGTVEYCL